MGESLPTLGGPRVNLTRKGTLIYEKKRRTRERVADFGWNV